MLLDGKTFRSFSPILGMKGCKSTEHLSMVLRYSALNNAACPKRRGKGRRSHLFTSPSRFSIPLDACHG